LYGFGAGGGRADEFVSVDGRQQCAQSISDDPQRHLGAPCSAFPTAGHLAAYAGLAPVTRRSGSSIKGEHPPKGGNKSLKRAMFLSAFASLSDPVSRAYYDKKRTEGKKHNAALICLARRRSDVIYAMLHDKQPYQPTRKIRAQAAQAA
jgi:transposase